MVNLDPGFLDFAPLIFKTKVKDDSLIKLCLIKFIKISPFYPETIITTRTFAFTDSTSEI